MGGNVTVFINYRREDSGGHAGRLHGDLTKHFGRDQVFKDIETGKEYVGRPWPEVIEDATKRCDLMIAMIGKRWLEEMRSRLDQSRPDWVRLELQAALERPGLRVIPVLVDKADMPGADDLPEEVRGLAERQALEIFPATWEYNVGYLIEIIEGLAERKAEEEESQRTEEEKKRQAAEDKARRKADEEAARKAEEEEANRVKAQEEEARRMAEEEAEADRQAAAAEEDAERKIAAARAAEPDLPPQSVTAPSSTEPAPTGLAPAWGSISELLNATGLKFQEISPGTVAVPFHSERAENLVVMAKLLEKAILLGVMLPKPGKRADEGALFNILRVAYQVNYVKAVAYESEDLAFGCEIPLSVLTADVAEGCIRSLSVLGDVNKKDMNDQDGWGQRQMLANHAQGSQFKVDAEESRKAIQRSAEERGFTVSSAGDENLLLEMPIMGAESPPLKVVGFLNERVVSLVAGFGDLQPKGDKVQYMRRLLELSRIADVAKIGLDSTGDISLMYEVPKVTPDLLGDVLVQFLPMTLGLLALEDAS